MKTPFERSYWVVPGKFLAGYYPGDLDKDMMSHKLNDLLSVGISTVIGRGPKQLDSQTGQLSYKPGYNIR
jgi:hypothetical protein